MIEAGGVESAQMYQDRAVGAGTKRTVVNPFSHAGTTISLDCPRRTNQLAVNEWAPARGAAEWMRPSNHGSAAQARIILG